MKPAPSEGAERGNSDNSRCTRAHMVPAGSSLQPVSRVKVDRSIETKPYPSSGDSDAPSHLPRCTTSPIRDSGSLPAPGSMPCCSCSLPFWQSAARATLRAQGFACEDPRQSCLPSNPSATPSRYRAVACSASVPGIELIRSGIVLYHLPHADAYSALHFILQKAVECRPLHGLHRCLAPGARVGNIRPVTICRATCSATPCITVCVEGEAKNCASASGSSPLGAWANNCRKMFAIEFAYRRSNNSGNCHGLSFMLLASIPK